METDRYWQMRLRQLEEQESQLMEGLEAMGLDEIRWTVRLLADTLTEERRQTLLAGYHEHLPVDRTQAFLKRFIPECTQLAILDLHAQRGAQTEGLRSLTDYDLQNMSAVEKWEMIAAEPRTLDPARTARELARLALCFQLDLLHDAMLSRAALEFPLYFRLHEALRQLPAHEIYRLSGAAAACIGELERLSPAEAAGRLAALRQEVARAAGFTEPLEEILGGSMDRLPNEFFPPAVGDEVPPDQLTEVLNRLEGLSPEDLRLSLQLLADQLTLREFQEVLAPQRALYPNLGQMPAEVLRQLVATLTVQLGDRTLCDFIQRYRTGKFLAIPPIAHGVWNLLPRMEQLRWLEQDNAAMDIAQTARHLARILASHEYQMLDDEMSQMAIIGSPSYQILVARLIRLSVQDGESPLLVLNRTVTGLVLEMERWPREARGEKLEEIRRTIGRALGLSEAEISVEGGVPFSPPSPGETAR